MKPLFLMKKLRMLALAILVLLMVLPAAGSGRAQGNWAAPGGNIPPARFQPAGPADITELEAFLNGLLGKEMAEYHIAGAAVSVVKDGRLFFAKGYGYADLKKRIPVDPEQTLFRVGSITKLFTWTAVMQLAEQGKLDLDVDINHYLDFRIPDTYPQPITLKHLMTHTAGFEDRNFETLARNASAVMPAREWLASHIPARVRPVGESAAYSNYGSALAGYIVARVSGQPYEQYIQEHILNPLGMVHTTPQVPVPPGMRSHESAGYLYQDGAFQVFYQDGVFPIFPDLKSQWMTIPIGGIATTATDMTRFMIAHLQNGRFNDASTAGARILKEATAQQMHSPLYTPDPRLLGTTYGFFDFSDNGQRTIGHSGTAEPMHALLLLLPDQQLGVFVAYNSDGAGELINQHFGFQRAFFDHYFPAPAVKPIQPPADFNRRASRFVGSYRNTASSFTTLEKVAGLMSGAAENSDPGDGTLLFTTPWGKWRFVEVGPLTFRQVDGPWRLAFREDSRGRVTHLFTDLTPMYSFEKINWYETPGFNQALLVGCMLIFLSMIPAGLAAYIRNRRLSGDRKPAPRGARAAGWIMAGISILNLLFAAGTMVWINSTQGFGVTLGVARSYQIVLGLGVLSAALTIGALICTALAWKNRYWGFTAWGAAARVYYTLLTVAAITFVWFLNYWNLLGWRF